MALFTDDEFLIALDDLHAPEAGLKKLVTALKTGHPAWKSAINTKVVREALNIIRGDDGAAAVAAARANAAPEPTPEPTPVKSQP